MSGVRPYLRPPEPLWWAHSPYRAYTLREATGVAVAGYGFVLLAGLISLASGERAYEAWLNFLKTPWSLALHLLFLIGMIAHAWTWFQIMPKTMPRLVIGGRSRTAELDLRCRPRLGDGGLHHYPARCGMDAAMKRSIAPIFWLLFGAGGMLAALTGPALVLITGLAAPTGIGVSPDFMSFARATAFAQHPLGKLILFGVIALFVWHGAERIYLTLRDMHAGGRLTLMWICYGAAGALTFVTVGALAIIGF